MKSLCRQIRQTLENKYKNHYPILSCLNVLTLKEAPASTLNSKVFLASVPSPFYRERVEKKILPLIEKELLHRLKNTSFTLQSVVENHPLPLTAKGPEKKAKKTALKQPPRPLAAKFNPCYTFDNFISGPSNSLALAAVKNTLDQPLKNPNSPLFLYGSSGLGKTHLLHALGSRLYEAKPHLFIHCLSAERFLHDCVQAIRLNRMEDFRAKYRQNTQVLLIDDIQTIEKGSASQEEFFHTFNAITEKKGLVVCTCDRLPKEIKKMQTRLQTRLQAGLVLHIDHPGFETRRAILQKKAEERKIRLPSKVCDFLADSETNSIRELEGHLNKLKMVCDLQNTPPTLSLAHSLFKKRHSKESIDDILTRTASEDGLSTAEMLSSRRTRNILKTRKKALFRVRRAFPHLSLSHLGRIFKKNHSSILYMLKKDPPKEGF